MLNKAKANSSIVQRRLSSAECLPPVAIAAFVTRQSKTRLQSNLPDQSREAATKPRFHGLGCMQISWYLVMSRLLSGEGPLSDVSLDKDEQGVRNRSS
jgi:hypothetical protein